MKIPLFRNRFAILALLAVILLLPAVAYYGGLFVFSPSEPKTLGITQRRLPEISPSVPNPKNTKRTVYVSPNGTDKETSGNKSSPYKTISYAISKVTPGTQLSVLAGTYTEQIQSVRDATLEDPIVIQAIGHVVLQTPNAKGRLMQIFHDYYVIDGFEFTSGDSLLWLQEADHTLITNNYFHHANGECVRIKYQSAHNLVDKNKIEHCGLKDFTQNGDGKNGEGIYIGTAPEQLDRNPSKESDQSQHNIVRNNTIATYGNECVDIKEGSLLNLVELNSCTAQQDKESGGMSSRGNENIFRYNYIHDNKGAGIRLGGDKKADGINNEVYGNKIENNKHYAIKDMRSPQGLICGNTQRGNKGLFNTTKSTNPGCPFELKTPGVSR